MLTDFSVSDPQDLLKNLDLGLLQASNKFILRNAGVLLFAENPQKFFPESFLTCVRFRGLDKSEVLDRQDFKGTIVDQIDGAFEFIRQRQQVAYVIGESIKREERFEYPLLALREVIVNAVMHRDYLYQNSRVYLNLFADRLEVENPGGLMRGMQIRDLGKLSIRRNPLIAEMLQRIGYVEAIGSGMSRVQAVLKQNGNPPYEVDSSDFFRITLYPRDVKYSSVKLTSRQVRLLALMKNEKEVTKREIAELLGTSDDTALRELKSLEVQGVIKHTGIGKATRYILA